MSPPHKLSAQRWNGLRVGLLGGSFNPPHEGHELIARMAMKRFRLHAVWWLVSPGNPLKKADPKAGFVARLQKTRAFVTHPRMVASGIENDIGARFSYQAVRELKKRFPKTRFVWIAGMDNALIFDRWDHWRDLARLVPFVFFNRPPAGMKLANNVLRRHKGLKNHTKVRSRALKRGETGIFWMMGGKSINLSSTQIRAKAGG